jgi:hypothetical protein
VFRGQALVVASLLLLACRAADERRSITEPSRIISAPVRAPDPIAPGDTSNGGERRDRQVLEIERVSLERPT